MNVTTDAALTTHGASDVHRCCRLIGKRVEVKSQEIGLTPRYGIVDRAVCLADGNHYVHVRLDMPHAIFGSSVTAHPSDVRELEELLERKGA